MRSLGRLLISSLLFTAGCFGSSEDTTEANGNLIVDELHNEGAAGFFWLPPVVEHPAPNGDIVEDADPVIKIYHRVNNVDTTLVATFTRTNGPVSERIRLKLRNHPCDPDDNDGDTDPEGYFVARWHTWHANLSYDGVYRIHAYVPARRPDGTLDPIGRELGLVDVDIVRNRRQYRRVDRDEFVPLINGTTLRIKFRIDRPSVDADADGDLDWNDNCPHAANASQIDSDNDGLGDACECDGVVCAPADQCHAAGVCQPSTGQCTQVTAPDGTSCNDGDACTQTDTCSVGVCVGTNPVTCAPADQCHAAGTCDPATGVCSGGQVANGTSCDDGDACTQSDSCSEGACVGSNPVVCTASDQCHAAGTCDPSTGTCSNPDAPDGTACDDANACSAGDTCLAGACSPGGAVSCDDGDACSLDFCDATTGCNHILADADLDGSCDADDCAPNNPDVRPGAIELCDAIDNDCSPATADGAGDAAIGVSCDGPDSVCSSGTTACIGGNTICAVSPAGSGQVCRSSAGACDAEERCDGTSTTCPADGYAGSDVVCRGSAGACDVEEHCDGTSITCPGDSYATSVVVCRASAGACDVSETCSGSSVDCPSDQFQASGLECRASAGFCDVAESCTGSSAACPTDQFQPSSLECRASAGICDVAESCTGSSATCPNNQFAPTTQQCRASTAPCDGAETCTGSSATCPPDILSPSGTVCRGAAGPCDQAESCSGSSSSCPPDLVAPATRVCRASAGICDIADTCSGISIDCPVDRFAASTVACRGAVGPCDVIDRCTGSSAACPADQLAPANTVCRASTGLCDPAEVCNGTATTCPTNRLSSAGTVCRGAVGECDVSEACNGTSATCPSDQLAADGLACTTCGGDACSGSCAGGTCVAVDGCGDGTLEHQWTFDALTATTEPDRRGGITATFSGPVQRVAGVSGGAISMTSSTRATAGFGTTVGNFGASDFTVSFWMRTSMSGTRVALLGKRGSSGHGSFHAIRLEPSGVLIAEVDQDAAGTNHIEVTGSAVNDGQWHHVASVRQGGQLSLYVDGMLAAGGSSAGTAFISNSDALTLGNDTVFNGQFIGSIDDLKIYSRGLGELEVASLAWQSCEACGALVHRWSFDETSATSVFDLVGGVTGSIVGSAIARGAPINGVHSITMPAAAGSAITLGDPHFGASDFTVSYWLRTTESGRDLLGTRTSAAHGPLFSMRLAADGRIEADVDQLPAATYYVGVTSASAVNDGGWHHVAMVRRANELLVFIDGGLAASGSAAGTANVDNGQVLAVSQFEGGIDDLRIYNRALDAIELAAVVDASCEAPQ